MTIDDARRIAAKVFELREMRGVTMTPENLEAIAGVIKAVADEPQGDSTYQGGSLRQEGDQ